MGHGRPPEPPRSGAVTDRYGVEWRYQPATKKWRRLDLPFGESVAGAMRWSHLVTYRGPVRPK